MKIKRSSFCFAQFIALSLGVQFAGLSYVYAGTYTWNNTGTDWNSPSSWSGGGAPIATADVAVFGATVSTNPNLSSSVTIERVTANASGASSSYTLSSGNSGVALTLVGTGTATNSALNYSPASGTFTISAPLIFGAAGGLTQTINVQDVGGGGTISISGPISSTNSITLAKTGAGTLELLNANSYTGNTSVGGGTLAIGNNSALSSGSLTITTTTTIRSNGAAARTLANDVNLTGQFPTFGTSTTGNLTFGALAATGTASNKFVTVNNAQTTFSSYGGVGLNFTGTGTGALVFTGNFSTNGNLIINNSMVAAGGTLTANAITLGGGVLGTNGTFTRSLGTTATGVAWTAATNGGFAAYGGDLSVNLGNAGTPSTLTYGTTNFISSGSTLLLSHAAATGTVDFRNSLNLAGAVQTVQVNNGSAAIDAKLTGTLSNGGLTKTGAGTLELTGANDYAGGTIVSAGKLLVNNTTGSGTGTGSLTVDAGASLGGSGTIGSVTSIAGTLNPGNSPGILTFSNAVTLETGSATIIEINGATTRGTDYDGVNFNGSLTVNGGTLTFNISTAIANGSTLNIFDGSSLTSALTSVSVSGIGGYDGLLIYNGSTAYVGTFGSQTVTFTLASGDLSFAAASLIPEPSSYAALLGAAVLGLGTFRRRQGRR